MIDKIDVTVDQLLRDRITNPDGSAGDLFLGKVVKRNTRRDGTATDPGLLSRMCNHVCQGCHLQFKSKYPNHQFEIQCSGIYSLQDYQAMQADSLAAHPEDEPPTIDEIREIYDIPFWAERHIVVKNDDGDLVPFVARWYQEEQMSCTARHIVDRWGRGTGKTTVGVIKELHKVMNNKMYETLVICPADSQSEKWYNEIHLQIENSPTLRTALAGQKQQPFKVFKFKNGSQIAIFTAGSASGRGANAIRSQSPRRVHAEEQDYLAEKDWEAIDPLIQRYDTAKHNPSEFHGSSTPTGGRGKFWEMCNKFPRYREFHFPVTVLPGWNEEQEYNCRLEAKTEDRYQHEYMAEFGDPTAGVFKSMHIDVAKLRYFDSLRPGVTGYAICRYSPSCHYFMGVDWNGEGTGTRICVLEYDPLTKKRRVVARHSVSSEGWTQTDSITKIIEQLRVWQCDDVYIDHGYGAFQDEVLRLAGFNSDEPAVRKLIELKVIDFGGNLLTNNIVPRRNPNLRAIPKGEEKDEFEKRRTKPYMVDTTVMAFEHHYVEFSDDDHILEEQLRGYRVKTYSVNGWANTYTAEGRVGDHDLDAFMLAMLGVEQKFGLLATKESYQRLATVSYVSTFGVPNSSFASGMKQKRELVGAPERSQPAPSRQDEESYRIMYLLRGSTPGAILSPNASGGDPRFGSVVPSRTAAFRSKPGDRGPRRGR
jgi:hypothetical protein